MTSQKAQMKKTKNTLERIAIIIKLPVPLWNAFVFKLSA